MPALVGLLWVSSAWAADPCDTPRAAAASLLQGGRCFDVPADMAESSDSLASQLRDVLNARGLALEPDVLPADSGFQDETGLSRIVPIPAIPELVIERVGGRWMWSRASIRAIPRLHRATFSPEVRAIIERLPPAFHRRLLGLAGWQLTYLGVLAGSALVAGRAIPWFLETWGWRTARRLGLELDAATIKALRRPMTWFVAGAILTCGIPDLHLGVNATRVLRFGAGSILSVSGVMFAARLVDVVSTPLLRRASRTPTLLDDQFVPLASRAARAGVLVLGVVFVLQNWGVDVGSLLAGLGIGGLAVALAAKDTLSNLFGSVTLFTDRPFQVGDWVVLDGSVEGVVEDVGFRSTRIRTFPDSVVSLPNGRVADARIENMGQRRRRRVRAILALTYDTPVERIGAYTDAVRSFLRAQPDVYPGQIEVHLNDLGTHSLDVLVYFFLDVADWSTELARRAECLGAFLRLAAEHDVRFAFPSTSVYVEQLPQR